MLILRTCNAAMLALTLALGVAACDKKDGPAEEIGEEIDDAASKVKKEAKEAKEEIKEEIDEHDGKH